MGRGIPDDILQRFYLRVVGSCNDVSRLYLQEHVLTTLVSSGPQLAFQAMAEVVKLVRKGCRIIAMREPMPRIREQSKCSLISGFDFIKD